MPLGYWGIVEAQPDAPDVYLPYVSEFGSTSFVHLMGPAAVLHPTAKEFAVVKRVPEADDDVGPLTGAWW